MEDYGFQHSLADELPRLYRLARRLTPPGVDPEDLTQDVLERAWRSRDSFREDARFSTWLHRIMVNRAGDLARRRGTQPQVDYEADVDGCAVEIRDPSVVLERAADEAALRAALSRLDPEDRTVLVLRDGEGWKASQLAELLAISPDAVYKRLQRGRVRLAAELSRSSDGNLGGGTPETCRLARARVSGYLDGRLEPKVKEEVDRHLRDCTHCPPFVQAVVGVREAMLANPEAEIPDSLTRSLEATTGLR